MQHIAIRREHYVAGITQRPEVDVFTQTHVSQKRYAAGPGGVRDSY